MLWGRVFIAGGYSAECGQWERARASCKREGGASDAHPSSSCLLVCKMKECSWRVNFEYSQVAMKHVGTRTWLSNALTKRSYFPPHGRQQCSPSPFHRAGVHCGRGELGSTVRGEGNPPPSWGGSPRWAERCKVSEWTGFGEGDEADAEAMATRPNIARPTLNIEALWKEADHSSRVGLEVLVAWRYLHPPWEILEL